MKENSHIFFAEKLARKIKNKDIKEIINENPHPYFLGSIFPDIFFHNKKTLKLADKLHGKDGEKTNKLILDLIEDAKKEGDKVELAFAFGYITHMGLDIKTHPAIYYLSGNYYDDDEEKREFARGEHRRLETILDLQLIKDDLIKKYIKLDFFESFRFRKNLLKKLGISENSFLNTFKKFLSNNKFFRSCFFYYVLLSLVKLNLHREKNDLKFFYCQKNGNILKLKEDIILKDLKKGVSFKTNFSQLFTEAEKYTISLIENSYLYYRGDIDSRKIKEKIKGESLDTGKLNFPVSEILYTK